MLKKGAESPLDSKEIKPVNPKGNQLWIFFGRADAEAETPVLCTPDAKSWLTGKDPSAGKDWRQEKRVTEDEVIGWHHQFNGHEVGQTSGGGEGQGGLVCCSPSDLKESDTTTEQVINLQIYSCLGNWIWDRETGLTFEIQCFLNVFTPNAAFLFFPLGDFQKNWWSAGFAFRNVAMGVPCIRKELAWRICSASANFCVENPEKSVMETNAFYCWNE